LVVVFATRVPPRPPLFPYTTLFRSAAVSVASTRELGLDPARVNVHGGAIALGHPIGSSGTRLVVHAALELARRGGGRAAAARCGGGGQGDALRLHRRRLPVPSAAMGLISRAVRVARQVLETTVRGRARGRSGATATDGSGGGGQGAATGRPDASGRSRPGPGTRWETPAEMRTVTVYDGPLPP